jgi:hypothetical protein
VAVSAGLYYQCGPPATAIVVPFEAGGRVAFWRGIVPTHSSKGAQCQAQSNPGRLGLSCKVDARGKQWDRCSMGPVLIMAGGGDGTPPDYDQLERWTRVGYERGMRSIKGER